jgi:hypothetical protein
MDYLGHLWGTSERRYWGLAVTRWMLFSVICLCSLINTNRTVSGDKRSWTEFHEGCMCGIRDFNKFHSLCEVWMKWNSAKRTRKLIGFVSLIRKLLCIFCLRNVCWVAEVSIQVLVRGGGGGAMRSFLLITEVLHSYLSVSLICPLPIRKKIIKVNHLDDFQMNRKINLLVLKLHLHI